MDEYTTIELKTLIKKLKSNKNSYIFLQPVEELINSISDYAKIIKNPIDLNIIINKFENNNYKSIEEFKSDFDLMIKNCLTYNYLPNSWANKIAVQFNEFFNNNYSKLYSKIEKHIEKSNNFYLGKKRNSSFEKGDLKLRKKLKIDKENSIISNNKLKNDNYSISNYNGFNNNMTVINYNNDLIKKRLNKIFSEIKPFLIESSQEQYEHFLENLISGFSKRNKSFDELYDSCEKFINKYLKNEKNKEIKLNFLNKLKKFIRTIKDENFQENKKNEKKNLNIKIDLNENQEKRNEKNMLENIKKQIRDFIENQNVPNVYLDSNEYSLDPILKNKIYNYVLNIRNKLCENQPQNLEKNDLIDLDY
jgi:hypothetical protein